MTASNSGDQIGNYKILHKLAEGGMAFIYKALQPSLSRTVVLKKLKDPNREIINRFKKEALLSASFNHENLAAIYDFFYIGKSYYLAMEYIEGEDLRTIIDSLSPLSSTIAGLIILGIARGLEYTHARNIIHRDIKPSNILVSYEGDVKLIDFGVAKDDVSTRLTLTGMIVGTPAYMAPEQANGDALSAQSDLFPLGILLYEMTTGIKPFYGENNTEILARIVQNKYTPAEQINPEIPTAMRRIIKKSLRKERSQRYQNAGELIHDLENFIPWQLRSRKKEVLSRFMERIPKAKANSTNESMRLKQLVELKSWPWQTLRILLMAGIIYITAVLFMQFSKHQTGYLQLSLPKALHSVQLDQDKSLIRSASTTLGPLLRGSHKLTIRELGRGAISIIHFDLQGGSTLALKPSFNTDTINPKFRIDVTPSDAAITINNQLLESSAFDSLNFIPGTYRLMITHPDFRSIQESIQLKAGENYRFQYLLTRK